MKKLVGLILTGLFVLGMTLSLQAEEIASANVSGLYSF